MARQIQIIKGTTAQNEAFTGAEGVLTYDTEKKNLRIHDGTTEGGFEIPSSAMGDYVVESQEPTEANGYTWYRLYKSGWVEQGGEVPYDNSSSTTKKVMNITLPIIMSNTNYYVNAIFNGFNEKQSYYCSLDNCSNNSITIMNNTYTSEDYYCFGCRWEVSGMSAQGA